MEDKTEGWTERFGQYPKEGWAIFWSNQSSKDGKECFQVQMIDELKILSSDDEAIVLAQAKGFEIGSDNNKFEVVNYDQKCNEYDTAKICERIKNRTENNHHTADEVINMIADTLREADAKFIEQIANQILTSNVKHLNNDGDDLFELS